jgi:hypothetical protein
VMCWLLRLLACSMCTAARGAHLAGVHCRAYSIIAQSADCQTSAKDASGAVLAELLPLPLVLLPLPLLLQLPLLACCCHCCCHCRCSRCWFCCCRCLLHAGTCIPQTETQLVPPYQPLCVSYCSCPGHRWDARIQ